MTSVDKKFFYNACIAAALVAGISFGGCGKNQPSDASKPVADVQVQAHRGGAAENPENTIVAFKFAQTVVGANSLELDVRPTSDDHLVIYHNPTIDSSHCLDPDGNYITKLYTISSMTYDEVRKFDCGTPVHLPKGPMPSFEDVLNAIEPLKTPSGNPPHYTLHIKWESGTIDPAKYVGLILGVVQNYPGVAGRMHFMADSTLIIDQLNQQSPGLDIYWLDDLDSAGEYQTLIKENISTVIPMVQAITPEKVQAVHAMNKKIFIWGTDQVLDWQTVLDLGVDGIITDDPFDLKELMAGKLNSRLNPFESISNGN
jgi:glycerophosphoryl diester phosphodiesterase